MHRALLFALLAATAAPGAAQSTFSDDFNDNYIADWDQRCHAGTWSASGGFARVSTSHTCSALVCPGQLVSEDVSIQISGTATHVFGMVARLDSGDTGLYAYVSPNYNVARIRLVSAGETSTILNSLDATFPDGVTYELTFTCSGPDLSLLIKVPSTGQQWTLNATDPNPREGEFGLASGDEALASFDWISCVYAPSFSVELASEATNDDMVGESSGDGDCAFEAGEQIELNLGLENCGATPLTNSYAVLQSLSSSIGVVDNYEQYGTIQPGEIGMCLDHFVINSQPFAPMQVTYPMRLTMFADGGFSQQMDFEIPLGNGTSCNVEAAYSDWGHSILSFGWGDNWHMSTMRNHTTGGTQSFKCGDTSTGDYDDHLYCGEASPWFNVPHNGVLTFWMWTDVQTISTDLPLALDGCVVEIGQFDNWTKLTPSGGYTYEIATGSTGPFAPGSGVFSGTFGWQLVTLSFTEDQTGPQRLRFVFGSDNAGTREGWYIDDISVTGSTGIGPDGGSGSISPLSVTASPNPFADMILLELQGANAEQTGIEVFDLTGRLVRELSPTTAAGSWMAVWDGRDSAGQSVPAGFYVARCSNSAGEVRTIRMIRTN
jgi:hypothetical protein